MVVSRLLASLSPSRLRAPSHAPPLVLLHRLLSSYAADASSSTSFAAEDYLVSRCGLTQAQALKVAAKLSHLRSQAKPEAVLAFIDSTLGIPAADIARVVVFDPTFLCADVEKSLARRVAELRDLGLSRDEIARLVTLAPNSFRNRSLRSNLEFWLAELGSFDKLVQALRSSSGFLSIGIDTVARPNVSLLRQCGMNISEIVGNNMYSNRLIILKPDLVKDAVKRVEELGFKRGTVMFRRALTFVAYMDKELIARKMQLLQNLGFSKADALAVVRKQPFILGLSEQKVRGNVDFLMKDVGLEVSYIVRRPVLLMYSIERRLLPRHCLLKALREKGLLKDERDFYATASMSEKIFAEKFVHPFKNLVPGLTDDYASKCLGKATGGIRQPED